MTGGMTWLANMAAGSVRIFLGLLLIFHLQQRADLKRKALLSDMARAVLGAGLIEGLMAGVGLISSGALPDYFSAALEALWIAAGAGRFSQTSFRVNSFRMNLFVAVFWEIAVSLWQFLIAAWLGVFFQSPRFLEPDTAEGQAAVWLFSGLLAGAAVLMAGKKKAVSGGEAEGGGLREEGSFSRPVTMAAVIGLLAAVSLSEQNRLVLEDDELYRWTILSVVLIMGMLLYNMQRQYEGEKEIARLKSEQAELLERDYLALNQAYSANARLFHDFHHHIGAMRQLLAHDKYKEAAAYLDELQAPLREIRAGHWTGDETADYLISVKKKTADDTGIAMQIQVEFPRRTNIRSADLCTILGNLLDNALEAAAKVTPQEERFIRLTIRRINQMLVIKVENCFAAPLKKKGGELQTTKEGGLHGWGLKSARAAAERYDGTVQTSCEGEIFRAVVLLSYQKEEL